MARMAKKNVEEPGLLISLVKDVAVALVIAGVVLYFIRPTIVQQTSMQDTMNPNDYLIMYRQAYRTKTPQRGDIIIFQSELLDDNGKEKLLIKRVIGLPGDKIEIKDDYVYINGEKYEEDYLKDGYTTVDGTWNVPEDCYFVMGDNRVDSVDSRYEEVGYVEKSQIQGKVVLRLFPFNRIQTF
jgi:signal peptidase I